MQQLFLELCFFIFASSLLSSYVNIIIVLLSSLEQLRSNNVEITKSTNTYNTAYFANNLRTLILIGEFDFVENEAPCEFLFHVFCVFFYIEKDCTAITETLCITISSRKREVQRAEYAAESNIWQRELTPQRACNRALYLIRILMRR